MLAMAISMKSSAVYPDRCLFVVLTFCLRVALKLTFDWKKSERNLYRKDNFTSHLEFCPQGGDLQASEGPGQCGGQGTPQRNLNFQRVAIGRWSVAWHGLTLGWTQSMADFHFEYQPIA